MSQEEKRVPVRVLGPDEEVPPSPSAHHIGEFDQKFKDLSRLLSGAPARIEGERFPTKGAWREASKVHRLYADLFDSGSDYRVLVEVPSVPREQLSVAVTSFSIRVDRIIQAVTEGNLQKQQYQGRVCSTILRTTPFSEEVIAEGAEAVLNNGILEVRIPKRVASGKGKHKILPL